MITIDVIAATELKLAAILYLHLCDGSFKARIVIMTIQVNLYLLLQVPPGHGTKLSKCF